MLNATFGIVHYLEFSQIYKCIGYVRILFHLRCPPVLGFLVFCFANDFQRQLKLIEMK